MSSPNSDHLSPASGEASPEFYDATELTEDETVRKGTDTENAAVRHRFSAVHTSPSSFTSRWMQRWSKNTLICRSPKKCEVSLPLDNGHSIEHAENSEEVGTSVSPSNWSFQYNTKRLILVRFSPYFLSYYGVQSFGSFVSATQLVVTFCDLETLLCFFNVKYILKILRERGWRI